MRFQSLLLKLAFMCGNCEWIQCRIIHDVLLGHFIEWFWSKTNPQMMQGNLGRSFYRELSWSVMARATPSLFSSRVPTVRIFWQVLLARQGWLHWKMPQVGWYAVRWYFLWLVDLMLFLHSVFLMAMMMIMMLQLFGPWRVLTIFCHSLTVFEDQLQDVKKC